MSAVRSVLRRIRDFKTESPAELRRQLVELENNADAMGTQLQQAKMDRLQVTDRESRADGALVAPGQSLGIVSTVARVGLAKPRAEDAGTFAAICKGAGAASNTDLIPDGSLINGAAVYTIATSGLLQLIYCDGVNYWT